MENKNFFKQRRKQLFDRMAPASAMLFFSAPIKLRNGDSQYPFRQESTFWYLTGFNEPDALLLLINCPDGDEKTILFNREKDPLEEMWNGRRLGQEAAISQLQLTHAFPYREIHEKLAHYLKGLETLYYVMGESAKNDHLVFQSITRARATERTPIVMPTIFVDSRALLHEMRLYKSEKEIHLLRHAARISCQAHQRVMESIKPGQFEYQVEARLLYEFGLQGARFPAYPSIVAGGANGAILHYTENSDPLLDGTLVLVDAGCEYEHYAADITRTFPVNGTFSPLQRNIYTLVLRAQEAAIALLLPGNTIKQASNKAIEILVEGLVQLGILTGDVSSLIQEQAYKPYYPHSLGHWLGLDVHDVGEYAPPAALDRPLQEGMVLTVEPGLYFSENAPIPTAYRGMAVRIEDNVLITATGHEVLTSALPKNISAIEALIAKGNRTLSTQQ